MTHVITALCTREGDCVEVCPVDCIVPGPKDDPEWGDRFFIDPDTCIDCGACIPVCPPEAIFPEEDVPPEYKSDIARDAAYFAKGIGYWDYDLDEERSNGGRAMPSGSTPDPVAPGAVQDHPLAPDVIYAGFTFGPRAKNEGLLRPYKVLTWETIPVNLKDPDGHWSGYAYGVITFQVNKALVRNIPRDWSDLLKPEYKGQVALADDPTLGNLVGSRDPGTTDRATRETGTVKWFSATDGYGFISRDQGEDVFVHYSSIQTEGFRSLEAGQQVEFTLAQTEKGPQALDVIILSSTQRQALSKANLPGTALNQAIYAIYAAALGNGGSLDDPRPGLMFFKQLQESGNLAPIVGSQATLVEGQTPIILRWDYHALADKDALAGNAEVEVVIPNTGILAGVYIQAISAQARHPNAARLWLEFLYSDQGQLTLFQDYLHPVRFESLNFDSLNERRFIAAELLAKFPLAEAYRRAVFPTPGQLEAATTTISEGWNRIIGVQITAASGQPRTATDATFEQEVLRSSQPVLVDFWAPWCGPCRMVEPIVEKLAHDMAGRLRVVKINVDENPATARRYGIQSIPMMMIVKNGQIVDRWAGAQPEQILRGRLMPFLEGYMSQDEVYAKVKDIIIDQLGVDEEAITLEASFRDDLEADPLDLVELIMAFEEEFGGEISDDEAQKITTVGDAVNYLVAQQQTVN